MNIIGNIKSIFLFLGSPFWETCVWSFGFLSAAGPFSLNAPGKTTSWITWIYSTTWEEVDGTSSLTTKCQNEYIFWWDIFWYIGISQLPLLNTSFFFLSFFFSSVSSLLVNFIITYHTWFLLNQKSSGNLHLLASFHVVNAGDSVLG